jgi:biopolymer transport protein ExbD
MTVENGHTPGQLLGEVNVTPMIDILLVLLIIFMVISPVLFGAFQNRPMPAKQNQSTPLGIKIDT